MKRAPPLLVYHTFSLVEFNMNNILISLLPDYRQSAGGSTLYLQHMMGDYLHRYGRLVDGPEEENKGLDNFTAAAKALSTGHRRGTCSFEVPNHFTIVHCYLLYSSILQTAGAGSPV